MWVCIWVCVSMYMSMCEYVVLYCPGQVPMGTRSSSAKNWGWTVTRRRSLNGSTIPTQGPTADAKLAARGHLINMFMFANNVLLGGGVKVRVWIRNKERSKEDQRQTWTSLTLVGCKFCAAGKECCKRGHGRVCVNFWYLMLWRPKRIRTIAAMWAQRTNLWICYAKFLHGGRLH